MLALSVRRLAAYWIDFAVLALLLVGPQLLVSTLTGGFPFSTLTEGYQIELWVLLTISLPVWAYFLLCERLAGRTLGKRLLKLSVRDVSGNRIGWDQAFLRTFVRLLPWELTHIIILFPEPWFQVAEPKNTALLYIPNAMIILYVAVLVKNHGVRALHDLLANTRVHADSEALPKPL